MWCNTLVWLSVSVKSDWLTQGFPNWGSGIDGKLIINWLNHKISNWNNVYLHVT